jgi:pilus assembly protein Flp/PilA
MKRLILRALHLTRAEDGPTAVEYAVMMMLIFLVCFVAINFLGRTTSGSFDKSNQAITAAQTR